MFTCTGQAAPSPRAQIVWPSICLLSSQIMSISAARASPFTKRHIMLFIQSTPGKRKISSIETNNTSCPPATSSVQTEADCTFSAGRALAAALVLVEFNQSSDGSDDVSLWKGNATMYLIDVFRISLHLDVCAAEMVQLTDLSMTIRAAVPRPVWAWIRPSKSISTSSHTLLGMRGVEEPPGITQSRLSQPPRTPPGRQMFVSIKHRNFTLGRSSQAKLF